MSPGPRRAAGAEEATEVVGAAGVAEVSVVETDTEEEVAGAAVVAGDTVWIIIFQ